MDKKNVISTENIYFTHTLSEMAPTALEISHCHQTYEFLFVADGRGKYIIEGEEFSFSPGTLLIARPLEYHCIKINAGVPYERYVINFTPEALIPELRELFDEIIVKGKEAKVYSALGFSASLISVFDRFSLASSLNKDKCEQFMKLLLSELIMLMSSASGQALSTDTGELGARVIKYLNENIDKKISLDKIAKRFFVSKYYLCRAFKKHNGISVHGYINRKRIMLAKQFMESGETASGAAYRVGFGDYSAFYRAYVKIFGEAPTSSAEILQVKEDEQ